MPWPAVALQLIANPLCRPGTLMLEITVLLLMSWRGGVAGPTQSDSCVSYEPSTVRITGVLERRTDAGRPNYESISRGDEPETGYYLRLATPLCVQSAGSDTTLNQRRANVRLVQLLVDSAGYAQLRPHIGRTLTLSGTLSSAVTGHHHAPVVLQVVLPRQHGP